MAKRKSASASARETSTDDLIIETVAALGGQCARRVLVRRIGHRSDFAAALMRRERSKDIEIFATRTQKGRSMWHVRLIGETALHKGVGMIRVGESA